MERAGLMDWDKLAERAGLKGLRRMMERIKRASVLVLCVLMLAGCGGQAEPDNEPAPAPAPAVAEPVSEAKPTAGGVLRLSMRLPKTFNPLLNEDATVDSVLKLLFEPLLELDGAQKPTNRLAANVNFASDGMSVIITLKPGLKWADGEPITAYDVEYSLEVLKDAPERAIYKDSIRNIAEFSVIDELNIKLGYFQAFGGASYLLRFPVIPRHAYAGAAESPDAVTGSGLYEFVRFEDNELLTLAAGVNALGERPYISEVQALVTSDRETDLNAFEQNLTDFVRADIASYAKLANARVINADEYQTTYFDFIGFNFARAELQDRRVRMAVAGAIDKPKLVNDIYLDYGTAANAPIDPESWLYEPDTVSYAFDLERSAQLLAECGIRVLRVLVNEENEERLKIARALKENLEQSGVSVAVESESFDEYERRLSEGDFDLVVAGFNLSVIPELTFAFGTDAEMNYFGYTDPVMDGLLAEAFSAVNENGYRKAISDLQKHFADELPCISLVFRKAVVLTSGDILGERRPTVDNPLAGVAGWYCAEKQP